MYMVDIDKQGEFPPNPEITATSPADVLVIDVGAQYRRRFYWELAEGGFRSDMISYTFDEDNPGETPQLDVDWITQNYKAVHISGGGGSVDDGKTPPLPTELLDGRIAVWGNCLGAQLITEAMGGKVEEATSDGKTLAEYGQRKVSITDDSVIYPGVSSARVHMSHGYGITAVPEDFRITAMSGDQPASIESADGRVVATLFHPEVRDTIGGNEMMRRFLESAGVEPDPDYSGDVALNEYLMEQERSIAEKLESGARIEGFLSGGVDSMVAAGMVAKVARELDRLDQVRFTYVDNGHMRVEDDNAVDFAISQGIPVTKINAAERFFSEQVELENTETGEVFTAGPLTEEADPEIKRAIHGIVFARIAAEIIAQTEEEFGQEVYFVQGSNESDAVSSGRGSSKKIKSHHNIKFMEPLREAGRLIEPLMGIYKHHVRQAAEDRYGMPEEIASRQPFPGPGFAPRISVNAEGILLPVEHDDQYRLDKLLEEKTDGAVAGTLVRSPAKYVGNKGDGRRVGDGVFLSGLAGWGIVDTASAAVTDAFADVTRTFYAPTPIEYVAGVVTRDNPSFTARLREDEELKRFLMAESDIDKYVSQHYVASLGVDLEGSGFPTLALRLFITGDNLDQIMVRRTGKSYETFVEGKAGIPGVNIPTAGFWNVFNGLQIETKNHGRVVYDTTHKPPGSTELE